MSKLLRCDTCDGLFTAGLVQYFGVNHHHALEAGEIEIPDFDEKWHFCSKGCLNAWVLQFPEAAPGWAPRLKEAAGGPS